MTTGTAMTRTRFDFDALPQPQRRKVSKKLARLRTARRVLHFIGFLSFWAVALGLAYLAMTAAAFLFVCLS